MGGNKIRQGLRDCESRGAHTAQKDHPWNTNRIRPPTINGNPSCSLSMQC